MAEKDTSAGAGPAVPHVTVHLHTGAAEHVSSRLNETSARAGKVLGCLDLGVVHVTTSSAEEMRTLAHEALRLVYVLEQAQVVHDSIPAATS
jgi:hypothetical protein